ncbi:MAG: DUF4054 domain-containing protein [Burkholderiaceae bacterium]|nr:DUF4054 domain-containing protein [Burkholderiaceae bacterium]
MPAPTSADLKARYPEFKEADDTQVGLAISDAALEVHQKAWGKFYQVGVLALAAHNLSLSRRRGGMGAGALTGPLVGKKVGEIQLNYAAPPIASMDEAMYASTAYGQRYVQLLNLVGMPIGVVA